MKPTAIHIDRVQVRVRGGIPLDPARLAEHISRALAARYRGPLPPRLTASLQHRLAGAAVPAPRAVDGHGQEN